MYLIHLFNLLLVVINFLVRVHPMIYTLQYSYLQSFNNTGGILIQVFLVN